MITVLSPSAQELLTAFMAEKRALGFSYITSADKDRKAKSGERIWKRQRDDAVTSA